MSWWRRPTSLRRRLLRDSLFALVALTAALLVRGQLVQPFHISGASMTPTLLSGDYVLVSKYAYASGAWAQMLRGVGLAPLAPEATPKRGDLIVFRNALDGGRTYVKRIVGVPGDTLALEGGAIVLNGAQLAHRQVAAYAGADERGRPVVMAAFVDDVPDGRGAIVRHNSFHYRYQGADAGVDDMAPVTVPDGHYFVLGDNRDASIDSRRADRVGLVAESAIVGRVERIALSTTPDFAVLDPSSWGEWRGGRFFAPANAEMRF